MAKSARVLPQLSWKAKSEIPVSELEKKLEHAAPPAAVRPASPVQGASARAEEDRSDLDQYEVRMQDQSEQIGRARGESVTSEQAVMRSAPTEQVRKQPERQSADRIEHIRKLAREGKRREALELLTVFVRDYPSYALSDDLAELAKEIPSAQR